MFLTLLAAKMPPPTAKFTASTPLWFLPKDSAFHHRAHPSAAADDYGYFSRAEAEAACAGGGGGGAAKGGGARPR